MAGNSVRDGLVAALTDWKRHAAAVLIVLIAFGLASLLASEVAYYAAILTAFTIWMAWFVLTGVHFLQVVEL